MKANPFCKSYKFSGSMNKAEVSQLSKCLTDIFLDRSHHLSDCITQIFTIKPIVFDLSS